MSTLHAIIAATDTPEFWIGVTVAILAIMGGCIALGLADHFANKRWAE